MNQYLPSAPPPIPDYDSFYDIETVTEYTDNRQPIQHYDNENNQVLCNKKIILRRLILLFFILSVTFIIYDHNETIVYYFNKMGNIM